MENEYVGVQSDSKVWEDVECSAGTHCGYLGMQ